MHRYAGLDPALFRAEPNMLISRGFPVGGDRYHRQPHSKVAAYDPRMAEVYQPLNTRAVEFYFIYWELPQHAKGFRVGPSSPFGRYAFEPLTHALRTMNPSELTFYNWHRATTGRDVELRAFCRAFRALPAVPPKDFSGTLEPRGDETVWVKWFGDRLAVVNDDLRPKQIRLVIPKGLQLGHRLVDVGRAGVLKTGTRESERQTEVMLDLEPFELRTLAWTQTGS
jgi:hypothetical protein